MSIQSYLPHRKVLMYSMITMATAFVIWTAIGSGFKPALFNDTFARFSEPCENLADAMAAADRSRNGVSLTCNATVLQSGVAL